MPNSTKPSVTKDEARNGWTPERLAAYHKEREEQKAAYFESQKKETKVVVEDVRGFNPHKWQE